MKYEKPKFCRDDYKKLLRQEYHQNELQKKMFKSLDEYESVKMKNQDQELRIPIPTGIRSGKEKPDETI